MKAACTIVWGFTLQAHGIHIKAHQVSCCKQVTYPKCDAVRRSTMTRLQQPATYPHMALCTPKGYVPPTVTIVPVSVKGHADVRCSMKRSGIWHSKPLWHVMDA